MVQLCICTSRFDPDKRPLGINVLNHASISQISSKKTAKNWIPLLKAYRFLWSCKWMFILCAIKNDQVIEEVIMLSDTKWVWA